MLVGSDDWTLDTMREEPTCAMTRELTAGKHHSNALVSRRESKKDASSGPFDEILHRTVIHERVCPLSMISSPSPSSILSKDFSKQRPLVHNAKI